MTNWFEPETPKLRGPDQRLIPPSAKKRSIWMSVALALVLLLYFIGCSSVPTAPY